MCLVRTTIGPLGPDRDLRMNMKRIELTYLNGPDIARLAPSDELILSAIERGLDAQGRGEAVIEPRVHLRADPIADGHFVLRGSIRRGGATPRSHRPAPTARCSASRSHRAVVPWRTSPVELWPDPRPTPEPGSPAEARDRTSNR